MLKNLMNFVSVACSKKYANYLLTVREMAEVQSMDKVLKRLSLIKTNLNYFNTFRSFVKMANLSSQRNYSSVQ